VKVSATGGDRARQDGGDAVAQAVTAAAISSSAVSAESSSSRICSHTAKSSVSARNERPPSGQYCVRIVTMNWNAGLRDCRLFSG
jgi:hypothetical protein